MQTDGNSKTSQILQVQAIETPGNFTVQCTSDQEGIYRTTADLTLTIVNSGTQENANKVN